MTAMQLAPAALGQFDNLVGMWNMQLDNHTSSHQPITGEQAPSGTPYSQTVFLGQQAAKPFAFRMEEAAIDLEEMFNEWVVPHILKKIKKEHILVEDFDEETLEAIDESFANKQQRKALKEGAMKALNDALSGKTGAKLPVLQEDVDKVREDSMNQVRKTGAKRYIKIPENFFDGFSGKMTLNITNEQQNKQVIMQSLSQILQTVAGSFNPQTGTFTILDNPVLAKLFGQIIDIAGIPGLSPISLGLGSPKASKLQTPPAQQLDVQMPQQPQQAGQQPMMQ